MMKVAGADHLDLGDRRQALFDLVGYFHDGSRGLQVSLLTEGDHRCPGRGAQSAGAAPGHGRGGVDTARPVGHLEELVTPQLQVPVEDDGVPLEPVSEFMSVGGHRGQARETEVENRHLVPQLLDPGKDEPPQAAVDMEADAMLQRDRGQLLHGVYQSVRIIAGAGDDRDRVSC